MKLLTSERAVKYCISACFGAVSYCKVVRDPVGTMTRNQLHTRFQERRHAWQGSKATIMYANIFTPTIKLNQNHIQLFWVEVFAIIRNEKAKQAKSFRTQ